MVSGTTLATRTGNAAAIVAFATDAGTEEALRAAVGEGPAVVRRGGIDAVVGHLEDNPSPSVLLVDLSGAALALSEVDRVIGVCAPTTTVIGLGDRNDVALFRELLRHGLADYLVKPVTAELLQRTIAACVADPAANRPRTRTGTVIVVTGARGGAGATTLVANLGWLLANEAGRRVALVDADLQTAALHLMLGLPKSNGLGEALRNAHRLDAVLLDRVFQPLGPRLSVLTGEEELANGIGIDAEAMLDIIAALEPRFHYIIVDLPRRPDPTFRRLLERGHVRIAVASPTIVAARDVVRLRDVLGPEDSGGRLRVALNHPAPDGPGDLTRGDFAAVTGGTVDYEIPYSRAAIGADNGGQVLASFRESASAALRGIAADLSGRAAGPRPGAVSRLFGRLRRALAEG